MDFKRTTNSTAQLDDFIAGADTQEQEEKVLPKNGKLALGTKLPKELKVKIKKKYQTYTLNKFIEMALVAPIPHIKDEILVTIYDQAQWFNTTMSDFVKYKMGLIESPEPNDPKELAHIKNYIIFVDKEKKEKIYKIAKSLNISILTYSLIKIQAVYELKDIFTFDEIMQFRAEAANYELELDDYIAMRIRG